MNKGGFITKKDFLLWAIVIGAAVSIGVNLFTRNAPGYFVDGHSELVHFYNQLSLGQPKERVLQILHEGSYQHLRHYGGGKYTYQFFPQSDEWVVTTPGRLATEWLAVLHFDGDTLVSTYITIADYPRVPTGAPRPRPDREFSEKKSGNWPRLRLQSPPVDGGASGDSSARSGGDSRMMTGIRE